MRDGEIGRRVREGTCTVLGLGISNLPLLRMLVSMGARVTVRDRKSVAELGDAAEEFLSAACALSQEKAILTASRRT